MTPPAAEPAAALRVLFVCLGNICRSPSAQGLFDGLCAERGLLGERIVSDSCGTAAFHVGSSPDARAVAACQRRGLDISGLRARQINDQDFKQSHYILAMDRSNLGSLHAWAPPDCRSQITLFSHYDRRRPDWQVPDPYHEDSAAFDAMLGMLRGAAAALIDHLCAEHGIQP